MSTVPNSLRQGLFAEYLFNGNNNDTSGNSNSLSTLGTPTLTTDSLGRANRGYAFGGVTTNDAFYTNTTVWNPDNTNGFTIEVMAKPDFSLFDLLGNVFTGSSDEDSSPSDMVLFYLYTDGKIEFYIRQAGIFDTPLTTSTGVLTTNTWHHMIFTYNGSTKEIWIDGVSKGTGASTKNPGAMKILIGTNKTVDQNREFGGDIAFVRVWNRTLSDNEKNQLYLRGIGTGI